MKKNCWEFKNCGREPGGRHVFELGLCRAATEVRFDGVHEGKNAGRACWIVAGTSCKEEVQGIFAQRRKSCATCDFYRTIKGEEGSKFRVSPAPFEAWRMLSDVLCAKTK